MNYYILTLGCPKNSVDSEGMDGLLAAQGHTHVATPEAADAIIVNTCSFIAAAREETLEVLRDLGRHKRKGQRLIAAGCMAQSHAALVQAIPGVDALLSTQQWMHIGQVIAQPTAATHANGLPVIDRQPAVRRELPVIDLLPIAPPDLPIDPQPAGYADWRTTQIRRTTTAPSAYLKISDGCNLRCAFCTIPSFKGDMRSKSVAAVLAEARELVAQGVREIILVAQHLTDYGRDLGLDEGLAHLLDELCTIVPTTTWIRLMYAYPHGISARLIATMARHPQICRYLDMPLQHAHPATLRRMRRPPDTPNTLRIIADLRTAMPDITLRSTFIVGFPGETTEEFRALSDFLTTVQFDRVGVFRYSPEPETPAATLPDQVRHRVTERRWHELMRLQQEISYQQNQRWVGREIEVLIEGQGETDDGQPLAVGRSFRDAPEIDGQVFVWGAIPIGTRIVARVANATDYDLWGEAVRA